MIKNKLKFIDLFCGLGGFRIAFENQEATCVFSSEIDKWAVETYKQNFNETPSGDITKIHENDIPDHDILCAGFPCQPFSIAGKRMGFEDTRGTLFFDVARILKAKQPKAFILENVKGLVNHDEGKTLKTIEYTLKSLGYDFSYQVMNALDHGIPQNRERWYCVGFRNDLKVSFGSEIKKTLFDNFFEKKFSFPEKKELKLFVKDFIEEHSPLEDYRVSDIANTHIQTHLKIKNIDVSLHDLVIANEVRPSKCQFRVNGTVPCFTAKMGTGGNNVPIIVNYNRKLTEKECLKLMGFPDWYKIRKNHQQSYKQLGNSVVVSIINEFAEKIVGIIA